MPQSCNSSVSLIRNSTVAIRRISTFIFYSRKETCRAYWRGSGKELGRSVFKLVVCCGIRQWLITINCVCCRNSPRESCSRAECVCARITFLVLGLRVYMAAGDQGNGCIPWLRIRAIGVYRKLVLGIRCIWLLSHFRICPKAVYYTESGNYVRTYVSKEWSFFGCGSAKCLLSLAPQAFTASEHLICYLHESCKSCCMSSTCTE